MLEVWNHYGFRRYAVNTGWLFLVQALRMLSGLLVGVWVARFLGPEKYGVLTYAIAFAAVFGSISKLGLDGIIVRDLVAFPEKRDIYLGTAFWLKAVASLLSLGVIAVAIILVGEDSIIGLYIFIIGSGILLQSFDVVDFYFQSKVLSKYVSFCKIAQLVLSAVIKICLILTKADLVWFVLITLVDETVMAVSFAIVYKFQGNRDFYSHFSSTVARRFLSDSWPLMLSGVSVMIYMRVGQLMIKAMLGSSAVGLYSAAVRLSEAWYFIPVMISSSIFPALVSARKASSGLYYERLQRLLTFMTWVSIAVALPTALFSDWLVQLLYGAPYADAAAVLRVYVWAGLFVNMGVASGKWLLTENYPHIAFLRTALGAISNILLNLVLIPRFGVVGAAYSTLASYFLAGFLYDLLDPRMRIMFKMKVFSFFPGLIPVRP